MILENTKVKKNPITSILGVMLLTIGMCSGFSIWVAPIYWEVKSPILDNWWIYFMPVIPLSLGMVSLLSADRWIKSVFRIIARFEKTIDE
jgi:hypothetical protein